MSLEGKIIDHIKDAFKKEFDHEITEDISLQPTRKEFEGTYTFVVFPFLRVTKKGPEQSGAVIGEYLKENCDVVKDFNTVKGFLNISLTDSAFLENINSIISDESFGTLPQKDQRYCIEYSSPNTNKPLHLGHLRNNFLGYSTANILKANGYSVDKVQIINDRGIHICKSMVAYVKFGNGETPESSGIKGDHLAGKYYVAFDKAYKQEIADLVSTGMDEEQAKKEAPILLEAQSMLKKWEEGDEETVALWKKMNGWVYEGFEQTYHRMGVDFDKYYYESDTYLLGKDLVNEGLEKEVFYKKDDGSVWADLTAEKLDEKLLLRKDGTAVYMTQDLGTADQRYKDLKFDKSIYVVGNEQDYHFTVLFTLLKKLGKPYSNGLYHLSYGMVDLPSGKMKSREGTVVDADDLMSEMIDTAREHTEELGKIDGFTPEQAAELYEILGLGALKYFLLKVDPKKRMLFDPKESIEFQGNTGPFIQYTHARISAILRKADQLEIPYKEELKGNITLSNTEKDLIYHIADYHNKLALAADELSPAVIANYIYDLAKEYNRFYAELMILGEEDKGLRTFRVALSAQVARVIKLAMGLLGINVPERM
ncbi:arginine--tRNA ligase [Marinigracilibium pacificum]|uniref:Arginine--tRNA ligase n=1 Tax=Marinigracilibium pacificum TaxID=2729599 RepID=A0A848J0C1_9BACT|nr:arginine--tRNA ligase [Marinigracilibium pacificum]NMM50233.1 arginine--tRNA ligase [Marinigracilibium pacificum]